MNKREFLKTLLRTLPTGLAVGSVMPSILLSGCGGGGDSGSSGNGSSGNGSSGGGSNGGSSPKSVIVIGAGISGLAAASTLAKQGVNVTVLESQPVVGGRLKTDRSLGIPFDLGASWIHGPTGNPITPLAGQAGVNTFLTDDHKITVYDINGTAYSDGTLNAAEQAYTTLRDNFPTLGSLNQSFQAVFNANYPQYTNDRLWKYMLSAFLEFDVGGDISKLSSLYFEDDKKLSGSDVIATNGFDKLANFLANGLSVVPNSRVASINYSGNQVIVTTTDGKTYQSRYVIVSVPLGVLKNNSISFTPALPTSTSTAVTNLGMGNVNKFLLTWSTPFWDTTLQYIGFTPANLGQFNYFVNLNTFLTSANALMTFAFGDYATTTESLSDNDVINAIMSNLKAMYGNAIPNPTTLLRTKWASSVDAFGAYSFAANGTTSADFDTLATTINNQIFFAGEHTIRDYRGTVHGAYLSGIREANKILAL